MIIIDCEQSLFCLKIQGERKIKLSKLLSELGGIVIDMNCHRASHLLYETIALLSFRSPSGAALLVNHGFATCA